MVALADTSNRIRQAPRRVRALVLYQANPCDAPVRHACVFVAAAPDFSNWSKLGSGLPNAPVFRMEYNAADQILVAGTLGRGAWTLRLK
jgi:hypothetical protein